MFPTPLIFQNVLRFIQTQDFCLLVLRWLHPLRQYGVAKLQSYWQTPKTDASWDKNRKVIGEFLVYINRHKRQFPENSILQNEIFSVLGSETCKAFLITFFQYGVSWIVTSKAVPWRPFSRSPWFGHYINNTCLGDLPVKRETFSLPHFLFHFHSTVG